MLEATKGAPLDMIMEHLFFFSWLPTSTSTTELLHCCFSTHPPPPPLPRSSTPETGFAKPSTANLHRPTALCSSSIPPDRAPLPYLFIRSLLNILSNGSFVLRFGCCGQQQLRFNPPDCSWRLVSFFLPLAARYTHSTRRTKRVYGTVFLPAVTMMKFAIIIYLHHHGIMN